jgi:hypothetical protein
MLISSPRSRLLQSGERGIAHDQTTRVHHPPRRCGGDVFSARAVCRARSARRPDAAHRHTYQQGAGRSGTAARVAEFLRGLPELNWGVGHNVQIDYRWSGGDVERFGRHAAELAALTPVPDVIVAMGSVVVRPCNRPSLALVAKPRSCAAPKIRSATLRNRHGTPLSFTMLNQSHTEL